MRYLNSTARILMVGEGIGKLTVETGIPNLLLDEDSFKSYTEKKNIQVLTQILDERLPPRRRIIRFEIDKPSPSSVDDALITHIKYINKLCIVKLGDDHPIADVSRILSVRLEALDIPKMQLLLTRLYDRRIYFLINTGQKECVKNIFSESIKEKTTISSAVVKYFKDELPEANWKVFINLSGNSGTGFPSLVSDFLKKLGYNNFTFGFKLI